MKNDFDIVELMWLMRERKRKGVISIEGVPPLTFKGYGKDLKNYRIYGNTVNGESVGDFVETGEHAGEYRVPVIVEGKNLLQNTATSRTSNKVTFTVNTDGSVTCNGENDSDTDIRLVVNNGFIIPDKNINYTFTTNGTNDVYIDMYATDDNMQYIGDYKKSDWTNRQLMYDKYIVRIIVPAMTTVNNVTLYPMIRRAEIADGTYEPYHAPVTTNLYLPEQIKMVGDEAEYIDYGQQKQHFADGTETDVTLPALPTLSGTNTLTVGTEVQPSKVEITGRIKQV